MAVAFAAFVFTAFMAIARFVTKLFTINLAIFALLTVTVAAAVSTFIVYLSSQVTLVISQLGNFQFVAMYLPSNLMTCISIVLGVKMASTVYNIALNFMVNKAFIFKA